MIIAEPSFTISEIKPSVAPPWKVELITPVVFPGKLPPVVAPPTYKFPVKGLMDKTKQASSPVPPKKVLNKTDERSGVNFMITPSWA